MNGRVYGRVMWTGRDLAAVYWLTTAAVLYAIGVSGLLTPFFKLEVVIPLVVGLSGVFIALWLANRERNTRITEGHFYKLTILWHVDRVLGGVIWLFGTAKRIMDRRDGVPVEDKKKEVDGWRVGVLHTCEYHTDRIEALNVNTHVPADIRYLVLELLRVWEIPINTYTPYYHQLWENVETVQAHLLKPLGKLIDKEYFSGDCSEAVRKRLVTTNISRENVRGWVREWESKDEYTLAERMLTDVGA